MPLPQLLELLHKSNIRYPPNATREQLEDLLQRGRTVGVDTIRDNTKHQVVDVEVLPDQPQREFRGSNSRYKRVRRRNVSKSNNRQRRQRNNLRTNTDIIDVEFDLPPTPNDDGNYDNGLQIFVMGFVEAGKTAAELALDAATGTIRAPFVESNNNGWNNDEYNGRDDGDDYDRSREYKRERRRRRLTTRSIRPDYERATHLEQNEDSHYRSTDLACTDGTEQLLARPSAKINSTQTKPIHRSRNRSHDSDKPIYGLGYVQNESGTPSQHQHKRQWKDRLRNKFDAALGLDATAASTENVSYYDSWKRNIKAMGDSHKDRLRRNMQDDEKVSRASVPVNSTRVPQNRRSRMRAAKSGTKNESTSPPVQLPSNAPRIQKYKSNLRREEKPFWKERGSISSLLFDNNPSSFRKNMQKKSRKSLEVSPSEQCIVCFCHNTAVAKHLSHSSTKATTSITFWKRTHSYFLIDLHCSIFTFYIREPLSLGWSSRCYPPTNCSSHSLCCNSKFVSTAEIIYARVDTAGYTDARRVYSWKCAWE